MKTILILILSGLSCFGQGFNFSDPAFAAMANQEQVANAVPCVTERNTALESIVNAYSLVAYRYYITFFWASNSTYTACSVAASVNKVVETTHVGTYRFGIANSDYSSPVWTDTKNVADLPTSNEWVTNTLTSTKSLTQNTKYMFVIEIPDYVSGRDYVQWTDQAAQNGGSRIRGSSDFSTDTGISSTTGKFKILSE